jgi:hypothetical protein
MSFGIGFDFRATWAYVVDPASCTDVSWSSGRAEYPQTRMGVTFGETSFAPDQVGDGDSTKDPRVAGWWRKDNSPVQELTFRVNIPVPGQFVINLAVFGYTYCEILDADGVTLRYLLDKSDEFHPYSGGFIWDAAGNLWSLADWPLRNKSASIIVTGDHITLRLGRDPSTASLTYTGICHFSIASVGATIDSIDIPPGVATMYSGDKRKFTAIANYSDGTEFDVTQVAAWASSNPAIATVGAGGIVNAISPGTVNITATISGVTGTLVLTVKPPVMAELEPDWSNGIEESTEYQTNILRAYSSNEQRISLRKNPRTRLKFNVPSMDRRETGALDSRLWGWQSKQFGVPFWPDQLALGAPLAAGATEIPVSTSGRKYAAGGLVILWRNPQVYEVALIDAVAPDSLALAAPLGASWAADGVTRVIPVLRAYLGDSVSVNRLSGDVSTVDLEFITDPVPDVPPGVFPQYRGLDVLNVMPSFDNPGSEYTRLTTRIDPGMGKQFVADRTGLSLVQPRGFRWVMFDRDEIAVYRGFLAARKGAYKTFWVPSWRRDFELASAIVTGATEITIQHIGYAEFVFPDFARRNLALITPTAQYYRKVTAAVSGGGVEVLTLDSAIPANLGMETMVGYLTMCRLMTDDVKMLWQTVSTAEATLEFVEVPAEVTE